MYNPSLIRGIIFLRNQDGSASGGCFVEFLASEDMKIALSKDKEYMGSRFCHVTKSTAEEREYTLAKQNEGIFSFSVCAEFIWNSF